MILSFLVVFVVVGLFVCKRKTSAENNIFKQRNRKKVGF